jgi:hypothetical protein
VWALRKVLRVPRWLAGQCWVSHSVVAPSTLQHAQGVSGRGSRDWCMEAAAPLAGLAAAEWHGGGCIRVRHGRRNR